MDIGALKTDLNKALNHLPPDMVRDILTVAIKFKDHADAMLKVVDILKPHAMTIGMEMAMGVADSIKDDILSMLEDVFKERGIAPNA